MNEHRSGRTIKRRFWLRWPFLIVSIPLAVLVLGAAMLGAREYLADERIDAEVDRIRDAGYATDDASMNHWFAEHTSRQGTKDWNEVLQLAAAGSVLLPDQERIPYLGMATPSTVIDPSQPWAAEEEVAEYLHWNRPVIEQIRAATSHPTPVWQPINFDGFGTLLEDLQSARNLVQLLQLEAEHALYVGEAERALRALESMRGVAAAFNWRFCMVADLVHIAMQQSHHSTIRRSMALDIWDDDQLRRIVDQLAPSTDVRQRWTATVAGERAMMLASLDEHELWELWGRSEPETMVHQWVFALPSTRVRLLQRYREMASVGEGGIGELEERAEALDREWSDGAGGERSPFISPAEVHDAFLPAVAAYAEAILREETSRRFTLTALAVKRFQIQEGRWPETLSELSQVGLRASDWRTVSAGPFGYEVAPDGAYLWSYKPWEQEGVSVTRPRPDAEEWDTELTTIR